jgi:membrane protease subunit (stomatin/prohibitin family)
MGLFSRLLNELIDIIEWVDTTNDTLIWKYPRQDNAIKMGAKLTVRESQIAVFINQGKIADVFEPGMYELTTQNMPILTTLEGWKYGFESPFKVDVYFVSTRLFTNQKWGTKNPVMLRDAEFGPIRLRAFGSYAFKVSDAKTFLQQISATNPVYTVDEINEQLRNVIVSRGMDAVAASKIPVLDLAANYDEVGNFIKTNIQPDFTAMGLNLPTLLVENISLPPEVEQALDKRTQMGIIGNLGAYAQFQAANAIEKSAENTIGGNLGAAGMGLGVGAAMMGQAGNIFQQNKFDPNQPNPADAPPPLPAAIQYFVAVNGKQEGPFSIEQIAQLANENKLTTDTSVWKKGMKEWAAAGTLTELDALFGNTPPPLS